jgi:hypothetical protein
MRAVEEIQAEASAGPCRGTQEENQLIASAAATYGRGLEIIRKKNHDYAASSDQYRNFRSSALLGLSVEKAILVRVLDKITRIDNLLEHAAYVTDESLEDTAIDVANYMAILIAYRSSRRQ